MSNVNTKNHKPITKEQAIELKKIQDLIPEAENDDAIKKQMQQNPVQFFRDRGINTENLPPEVLDKLAGGFFISLGLAIAGIVLASTTGAVVTKGLDELID